MFEKYLGHTALEAGSLVVGGAVYGAINRLVGKLPGGAKIQSTFAAIPVVGPSLPTLIVGALIHKFSKNKTLDQFAKGLIGASVVGIGVSASTKIPGLAGPNFGEVEYFPNRGMAGIPAGMGEIPSGMGDVEYFPSNGMSGGERSLSGLGAEDNELGSADFGAPDSPDFGEIPENMATMS